MNDALATIDRLDASGDKVLLGWTATVMGRTVTHKDAKPVVAAEARAALAVLADLGAEFDTIAVFRHEG